MNNKNSIRLFLGLLCWFTCFTALLLVCGTKVGYEEEYINKPCFLEKEKCFKKLNTCSHEEVKYTCETYNDFIHEDWINNHKLLTFGQKLKRILNNEEIYDGSSSGYTKHPNQMTAILYGISFSIILFVGFIIIIGD